MFWIYFCIAFACSKVFEGAICFDTSCSGHDAFECFGFFRLFKIYVCMFFICFVKAYILKISSISESDYLLRRYLQMHGVSHSFFSHFVLVFLPWFGSYGFVNSLTGTSLVSFFFILIQSSELFSCCQRAVAFILLTHHTVCPTYYAKVAEYGLHRSRCAIFFYTDQIYTHSTQNLSPHTRCDCIRECVSNKTESARRKWAKETRTFKKYSWMKTDLVLSFFVLFITAKCKISNH